jgi:hypothetical protein
LWTLLLVWSVVLDSRTPSTHRAPTGVTEARAGNVPVPSQSPDIGLFIAPARQQRAARQLGGGGRALSCSRPTPTPNPSHRRTGRPPALSPPEKVYVGTTKALDRAGSQLGTHMCTVQTCAAGLPHAGAWLHSRTAEATRRRHQLITSSGEITRVRLRPSCIFCNMQLLHVTDDCQWWQGTDMSVSRSVLDHCSPRTSSAGSGVGDRLIEIVIAVAVGSRTPPRSS